MARKRRPRNKNTQPQPSAGVSVSGAIDTAPFIASVEKGITELEARNKAHNAKLQPNDPRRKSENLMPIFKMIVLKGDVQMFSKETHQLTLDQLNGPGPMAKKLAEGISALMYILFEKSNKTLDPSLLEPAGTVLLCHAFDYLQESKDPEATKEMFGDAVHQFSVAIHNALGVTEEQFNEAVTKQGKQPQPGVLGAQA